MAFYIVFNLKLRQVPDKLIYILLKKMLMDED